jgi:hypothetical protein
MTGLPATSILMELGFMLWDYLRTPSTHWRLEE